MSEINIALSKSPQITVSPSINLKASVGLVAASENLLAETRQLIEEFGFQVIQTSTMHEFPNIGKENCVYIDQTNNKTYRWNALDLKYYCIGSDYTQIETVNGGTANE